MNYLITGATGFIGRPLVSWLLGQGHTVNYLSRKRDKSMDSRAAFFLWDMREAPPLDCIPRLEAIIHLAGEPVAQRWTPEIKQRIRDSRVLGTRELVAAIGKLKHKPQVLVSASAIGYYGDGGERVLTETEAAGPGFLADVCTDWEKAAERARAYGVRVVTPRISVVLGRSGGALAKMAMPFQFGLGGKLGDGRQWMSWIHVDDMVRLLQFCAETDSIPGPVNAASPNPVTNAEFTKTLAQVLHRPAMFRVPGFALNLLMGEVGGEMMKSVRALPSVAEASGFVFKHPQLREVLTDCFGQSETSPKRSSGAAKTVQR